MAQRPLALRGLIFAVALTGLAGCSSLTTIWDSGKIDYRSAAKVQTKSLEVPPDLTQLRRDSRYAIPDLGTASATASTYSLAGQANPAKQVAAASTVLPVASKASGEMRIERNGNQRYLVIKQSPEVLWPQLKEFWQESGFLVATENAQTGVMETDWAENRAKLPQDIVRSTIGKVFDFMYSTSERDKFRTRLERAADGSTEIYISHRGMQEVLTGLQKDGTVWTPRPADPELEAEFLARLMTRFGTEAGQAKETVAKAATAPSRAKVTKEGDKLSVDVAEDYERAWRRVGLALDRVGFTVEDRDRTVGLYFVRYIDDATAQAEASRGFFSRLFFYDGEKSKAAKYRISVKGTEQSSKVTVQTEDGKQDNSPTAEKILQLVADQLK